MNDKAKVGQNFAKIASNPTSMHTYAVYKAHTPTIVDAIKSSFQGRKNISCMDLGGGSGALTKDITELMPGYIIEVTNIDQDEKLLNLDKTSKRKYCADITNKSAIEAILQETGKFNLALTRYVLNYNSKQNQRKIIDNAREALDEKGIFIVQHCGAHDKRHQNLLQRCFLEGEVVEKLQRKDCYWSTSEEVQTMIKQAGFETRILDRYLIPIGDIFTARYQLDREEDEKLRRHFGSYNFIDYTICIGKK